MMLTIHGLPVMVKYHDLKTLIKQECNINDFILDNLTADVDGSKKVRIGVADEAEGAHLCKCLNGFRMGGNVLRVLPVGKASVNQNTFDQRGGFMPRNDMPNQHGNFGNQPANFGNQFSNQTQHAQATWNTGSQSSQWGSNQQPQNQMRQANFDFQQRTGPQFPMQQTAPVGQQGPGNKPFGQSGPFIQNRTGPPEQGFGFAQPNKPQPAPQMRSDRSHVLRSVDIVQGPVHPNRYSDQKYDQNKPVVINKDYFQGPSQFDTPQQNYPQAGLIQAVPWSKLQAKNLTFGKPDVPQFESDKRHMPKNFEKGPLIHGQHERRLSPQDRRPSPHRRPSPGGPIRPPDRRLSPGRRVSPGRRMSPGRRVSPGRRMSPTGRRMSPGRRVSPNDRRAPVRKSPGRVSPHKRSSPGRRLVSPGRDNLRYSPSRRHDKPDFSDSRGPKQIRPAYEADAKAPNQAMYSDGYRPNLHENVSYPSRQTDQRSSSWQDRDKNTYPGSKKQDEDRRMVRGTEPEAKRSPIHKSRSPNRRDVRERSPLRDRYRRHSPSPRSPRRSWALEKRRSPEISEAPPPPVWPGQNPEDHYTRPTSKTQEGAKPVPVWDHRTFQETEASMRRENRLYDEEQMRMRRDAGRRDAIPPSNRREPSPRRPGFKPHEDMNRDTKFEPRDSKFESRDPKYDPREPKFDTRDPKFNSRDPKFNSRDPKFETREHKFETHVSRFDLRDSKFDQRDPKFEPRDPKFEPRDPNFQPRDPMFEPRDPKFEPRDPKFEPRDPKFIPRDPKFEPREPKFEPRDPKFEPREPKFEPRDPKFEPRDPKFEPRGPEYRPRDPKFEPHDPKFGPRGPKFERDNKYDSRDPKFDQRNPKFEMREPKFEARNTKYDPREPKFEPRDPKFNPREPKFEPRDPKFESRDPKFEPRGNEFRSSFDHTGDKRQPPNYEPRDEPKFGSRDTFGSRNTKFEQRDQKFKPTFEPVEADFTQQELDFGTRDSKFEPRESKYGARESKFDRNDHRRTLESPERKSYLDRDDFRSKRPEPSRDNTSRREEPNRRDERKDIRKPHDQFDLEFEDIYKRTREFKQKVEELKRAERNREEREPSRDQRRRDTDEDGRHSDRKTEGERRHQEDRPHSRQSSDKREPEWKPRNIIPRKIFLPSVVKAKRDKAVDEIANKLMHKYGDFEMTEEIKNRVLDELKLSIARIMYDMFGNEDISFIELVVKFNSKHGEREEVKIFEDVMSCFPKHHRAMKRPAQETDKSDIPEKSSRLATDTQSEQVSDWNIGFEQQAVPMAMPQFGGNPLPLLLNPTPVMVPSPFSAQDIYPTHNAVQHAQEMFMGQPQEMYAVPDQEGYPGLSEAMFSAVPSKEIGYNLYLCKDDFKQFTENQANYLKKFLIAEIFKVTETSDGWAPDFTLKGLQSHFRYEVHTHDERSKDWLLNLDFSQFTLFSVLVYTKEELWYERAAIWLPGHSRCRNIEPLDKLKLQNRKLEDVKIGKWKLVKKIVNEKGTRIYVDIPPSSARALEKHKMMLSYELQKVNVFLKAVAVDKDAFDAGLLVTSLVNQSDIMNAAQNSNMPVLKEDANIVKLTLKGTKKLTLVHARKIKEMVIYQLFKYHQQNGNSKTDFVKYGFCPPNALGVLPENHESRRWLTSTDIGRLNRQPIVVLGGDDRTTRYLKMLISVPTFTAIQPAMILERLKQSNQGVKGINFALWKPILLLNDKNHRTRSKYNCEVELDLESAETISKNKYKLDYLSDCHNIHRTVEFKPYCSDGRFEEKIARLKAELTDSYDVANMDLASSDSESGDVICLDNA